MRMRAIAITAPTTIPAIAPAESVDLERGVVVESGVGVGVGVDGAVSTLESELLLTVEMTDDVDAGVVPT
jgi:hypothetical protein